MMMLTMGELELAMITSVSRVITKTPVHQHQQTSPFIGASGLHLQPIILRASVRSYAV